MNCSSVYIFKNEEDRKNIEMYQQLAELVFRIEGEIWTDNIAVSKRADNFYRTYDEVFMTKRERKQQYEEDCQRIEWTLNFLEEKHGDKVSDVLALIREPYKSNLPWEDLKKHRYFLSSFFTEDYVHGTGLMEAYKTYCGTYQAVHFKTKKGDCFMWVSGKYHHMNLWDLEDVAETEAEKELVSKVMVGFGKHCEEGYWFEDLKEPKLPTWDDKPGLGKAM